MTDSSATANPLTRYYHWLHGQWPAGKVEKAPAINADGSTNVAGVYIVGDLTGIPLLKFSSDTGARVIGTIAEESGFKPGSGDTETLDVAIIGAGVSGLAAAMEASKRGLSYQFFEAKAGVLDRHRFSEGQADLHLPDGHDPGGRPAVHDRREGGPRRGTARHYEDEHEIETTDARIEKIDGAAARSNSPTPRAKPTAPSGSSSPSAAVATTARSASPVRNSTRSTTVSTIRRTSRARMSSWSAAATPRWRPPSHSAKSARPSP